MCRKQATQALVSDVVQRELMHHVIVTRLIVKPCVVDFRLYRRACFHRVPGASLKAYQCIVLLLISSLWTKLVLSTGRVSADTLAVTVSNVVYLKYFSGDH